MNGLLESFMKFGFAIIAIFLVIVIAIYVASAVFLNKFSMQVQNKRSAKAWIPVANLYLLGKLLKGKGFGWALVIAQIIVSILTATTTTTITINGESTTTTKTLVGEPMGTIINIVWGVACLGLFVWGIIKFIGGRGGAPRSTPTKGDYLTKEAKPNPADNLWGWKDSDSSKM